MTAGLLIDTTLCTGCGACSLACKEKNQLPRTARHPLEDRLSAATWTVVEERNGRYVRKLCLHCRDATCVSVCPVGAFEKTADGPVIYHEARCMGCRYCVLACPLSMPRFDWASTSPRIGRCDLCADRVRAGLETACASVCPTGATRFGNREGLIEEARARFRDSPGRYTGRIFGLEEIGGTAVLTISDLPPEALGFPAGLDAQPVPLATWKALRLAPGAALGAAALLAGTCWIVRRRMARAEKADGGDAGEHRDPAVP